MTKALNEEIKKRLSVISDVEDHFAYIEADIDEEAQKFIFLHKKEILILSNINTAITQLSRYTDLKSVEYMLDLINQHVSSIQSIDDCIYGVYEDLSLLPDMIEKEAKDKEMWQYDESINDFRITDYSLEAIECAELALKNLEKLI